jgi:uncharacterized membrane protein YgaE (UPF0421/DUF939 family)
MTNFLYVATNSQGKTITGSLEASDRAAAIANLNRQSLSPLSLKEGVAKKTSFGALDFLGSNRVKIDDLVMFTRQLSAMVSAGVPLLRALRKREKDARLKARQETDPLKQLEYKKEARKWEQRAEEEDDRARDERREASRKAEEYLDLIEESLKGNQEIEDIFTISWEIVE